MPTEIERKFLVVSNAWRRGARETAYKQGYLLADEHCAVRVRIAGRKAFLTIKGQTRGASRAEFEYPIPLKHAEALLRLCPGGLIEKTRHKVRHKGLVWEVDVFAGDNAGLVVAEVELKSEKQAVPLPAWVGKEVTDDPRYYNANLMKRPWKNWPRK